MLNQQAEMTGPLRKAFPCPLLGFFLWLQVKRFCVKALVLTI